MLASVKSTWLGRYYQLECFCSCVALAKLLQHAIQQNDSRLQDIVVKGDQVQVNGDGGVRTRSKSTKGESESETTTPVASAWVAQCLRDYCT